MGQVSSQGMQVALYINGAYKGYYNPTERIDEDFLDTWQEGRGPTTSLPNSEKCAKEIPWNGIVSSRR